MSNRVPTIVSNSEPKQPILLEKKNNT